MHEIDDTTGSSMFVGQPGIEGIGNALFFWGDETVKLVTWVDEANQVYELDKGTAQPTFVTNLQVFDNTNGLMAPVEEAPCVMFAADAIEAGDAEFILSLNSKDENTTTRKTLPTRYEAAGLFEMAAAGRVDVSAEGAVAANVALGFIDLDTGIAELKTLLVHDNYVVDGLAVRQIRPAQVPTLSEWGLIATALILFAGGMYVLVRKKRGLKIG